jgi:hypothetical protein
MTKFWGPLGWMTLHSVSLIYPENPTQIEQTIVKRFIELFRDTITCQYCKSHFSKMLLNYSNAHPEMYSSRQHFFLFVARAHNTVNARLDKPRPKTVAECLETIRMNTKIVIPAMFRTNYINYLANNWGKEFTGEGAILRKSAIEMKKINDEYWTPREVDVNEIQLEEADVITPIEKVDAKFIAPSTYKGPIGFKRGRLGR